MTTIETQTESPAWCEFATANEVINFTDLEIEIVPDDYGDAPWDNDMGLEHEVVFTCDLNGDSDFSSRSGFFRDDRRREAVVRLTFSKAVSNDGRTYGTQTYLHERGASKQSAFEAEMENQRRTREKLADWRANGWQAYGVRVSHEGEEIDSCWGFYDGDAGNHGKREVVSNALAILKGRGFIVRGIPQWVTGDKRGRQMPGNVHYFDHGYHDGPSHISSACKSHPLPLP